MLVNAAGLFIPQPFLDYDGPAYDAYLELDRAIFFLTQAVVRGMVAHGQGGAIVNVGSMWAHQGVAATPASGYSVAKGSLHALTRDLAIELAPTRSGSTRSPRPWSPPPSTRDLSPRTSWRRPCTASTASIPWAGSAPP